MNHNLIGLVRASIMWITAALVIAVALSLAAYIANNPGCNAVYLLLRLLQLSATWDVDQCQVSSSI